MPITENAEAAAETAVSSAGTTQTDAETARLLEENKALTEQLESLREQNRKREEREKGLDTLRRLTGSSGGELFDLAAKRAEQSGELNVLPPEKRYEMSYYLVLGEKAAKDGAGNPSGKPLFLHSDGSGVSPATELVPPTTFEKARENAKKYFGL